jgi:hypothetical protein
MEKALLFFLFLLQNTMEQAFVDTARLKQEVYANRVYGEAWLDSLPSCQADSTPACGSSSGTDDDTEDIRVVSSDLTWADRMHLNQNTQQFRTFTVYYRPSVHDNVLLMQRAVSALTDQGFVAAVWQLPMYVNDVPCELELALTINPTHGTLTLSMFKHILCSAMAIVVDRHVDVLRLEGVTDVNVLDKLSGFIVTRTTQVRSCRRRCRRSIAAAATALAVVVKNPAQIDRLFITDHVLKLPHHAADAGRSCLGRRSCQGQPLHSPLILLRRVRVLFAQFRLTGFLVG